MNRTHTHTLTISVWASIYYSALFSWQFFSIRPRKTNKIWKALRCICAIAIECDCVRTHLINIIHSTYVQNRNMKAHIISLCCVCVCVCVQKQQIGTHAYTWTFTCIQIHWPKKAFTFNFNVQDGPVKIEKNRAKMQMNSECMRKLSVSRQIFR